MHDPALLRLRRLRERAARIAQSLEDDLRPFLVTNKQHFDWLPDDRSSPNYSPDILGVPTACTALMALITASRVGSFYNGHPRDVILPLLQRLATAHWTTSGLVDDNPFTTILFARTAGLSVANAIITSPDALNLQRALTDSQRSRSLSDILIDLTSEFPDSIRVKSNPALPVNPNPPTTTLAYWLVDAIDNLNFPLKADAWRRFSSWATSAVARDLALATANHTALMDPISLAMGACLAARLNSMAGKIGVTSERESLPRLSPVELHHAVKVFWSFQSPSGIWPKYFPLFNYPKGGANYCFTFEVLEAMAHEFGRASVYVDDDILRGIENAIAWCENNRLEFPYSGTIYRGWNSGGDRLTLEAGKPESWATAIVHMFHHRLVRVLDRKIEAEVRRTFNAQLPASSTPDRTDWDELLDMDLLLQGSEKTTVKAVIEEELLLPVEGNPSRSLNPKQRRSALLFGPPGTSKTSLAKAVAKRLAWHYIEINPSHFLSDGLERIYIRSDEVFTDLMDLERAVVLFDEMDALVQNRGSDQSHERLDVTRQFLTTSMLPKLAKLHDRGRIIFFMATNYQKEFDQAIKRPGRFDLLICVAPPSWERKVQRVDKFMVLDSEDPSRVQDILNRFIPPRDKLVTTLDNYTFSEMRSFLEHVRREAKKDDLGEALEHIGERKFMELVEKWGHDYITLRQPKAKTEKNQLLEDFDNDKKASCRQ